MKPRQAVILSLLFYGHYDTSVSICPESLVTNGPTRETHVLIVSGALLRLPEARESVKEAVRRWQIFGTEFVVVLDPSGSWQKQLPSENELEKIAAPPKARKIFIDLGWGPACVASLFTLYAGYTWVEALDLSTGRQELLAHIRLCPEVLRWGCGQDPDCWAEVAQHELGHALGLVHRQASLLKDGGSACKKTGFTLQDYLYLYDWLRADRLRYPLLTH